MFKLLKCTNHGLSPVRNSPSHIYSPPSVLSVNNVSNSPLDSPKYRLTSPGDYKSSCQSSTQKSSLLDLRPQESTPSPLDLRTSADMGLSLTRSHSPLSYQASSPCCQNCPRVSSTQSSQDSPTYESCQSCIKTSPFRKCLATSPSSLNNTGSSTYHTASPKRSFSSSSTDSLTLQNRSHSPSYCEECKKFSSSDHTDTDSSPLYYSSSTSGSHSSLTRTTFSSPSKYDSSRNLYTRKYVPAYTSRSQTSTYPTNFVEYSPLSPKSSPPHSGSLSPEYYFPLQHTDTEYCSLSPEYRPNHLEYSPISNISPNYRYASTDLDFSPASPLETFYFAEYSPSSPTFIRDYSPPPTKYVTDASATCVHDFKLESPTFSPQSPTYYPLSSQYASPEYSPTSPKYCCFESHNDSSPPSPAYYSRYPHSPPHYFSKYTDSRLRYRSRSPTYHPLSPQHTPSSTSYYPSSPTFKGRSTQEDIPCICCSPPHPRY